MSKTPHLHADELMMTRALELAGLGIGKVSPNPMVGCVIAVEGKVIAEGWHQHYGGPHAEANAIAAVSDKDMLKQADVYVTLEPCTHHGKTPPCADLMIQHQVKRVIVSTVDTNSHVSGNGIRVMKNAGIDVASGVLEEQGRELNRRFFTVTEKKRPFILLKWARTADGFLAREDLSSKWISNEYSRMLVHRWRSEEDAVLVGTSTAAHDDPALTVRDWSGRNPIRIVIDRYLRLPSTLRLFDQHEKTLCYNSVRSADSGNLHYVRLDSEDFIHELISDLHSKKVQSVIVEGGKQTLDLFIRSGLWDEARIFSSSASFGKGVEAPRITGRLVSRESIQEDALEIFTRTDR